MIRLEEVEPLVRLLQASDVTMFECEVDKGVLRLRFDRSGAGTTPAQTTHATSCAVAPVPAAVLRSQGMGLLRLRHPLARDPFVAEGAKIERGTIVAVLQAGEVLVPVEADRDGVVGKFLATEDSLIGYGTPLLQWA